MIRMIQRIDTEGAPFVDGVVFERQRSRGRRGYGEETLVLRRRASCEPAR